MARLKASGAEPRLQGCFFVRRRKPLAGRHLHSFPSAPFARGEERGVLPLTRCDQSSQRPLLWHVLIGSFNEKGRTLCVSDRQLWKGKQRRPALRAVPRIPPTLPSAPPAASRCLRFRNRRLPLLPRTRERPRIPARPKTREPPWPPRTREPRSSKEVLLPTEEGIGSWQGRKRTMRGLCWWPVVL